MAKLTNEDNRQSLEEFKDLSGKTGRNLGLGSGGSEESDRSILEKIPNSDFLVTNDILIAMPKEERPLIYVKKQGKDDDVIADFKFLECDDNDFSDDETEECPTCNENPFAFVPEWTSMLEDEVFFNGKDCTHCIVVYSDIVNPNPNQLNVIKLEATRKMFEQFNKARVATAVYYVPFSERTKKIFKGKSDPVKLSEIGVLPSFHIFAALIDALGVLPVKPKGFVRVTERVDMIDELVQFATAEVHVPLTSAIKSKVLVCFPTAQIERIPQSIISAPETVFETNLVVSMLGPDYKPATRKIARTLNRYHKELLRWSVFDGGLLLKRGTSDRENFVNLNLAKEAEFIKQFQTNLLDLFEKKGLTVGQINTPIEKFTIKFEEKDDRLKIIEISANSPGCPDIVFSKDSNSADFNRFLKKRSSVRNTTLGYIGALPEMELAISARKPMSWLGFVTKFTYPGLEISLGPNSISKTTVGSCFADEQIDVFLNSLLDALVGLGGDMFSKTSSVLCRTIDEAELYRRDLNKQAKANLKRMLITESKKHIKDEQFVNMIVSFLEDGSFDFESFWSKLVDKLGYCGFIQMAKRSIDCVGQGLGFDNLQEALVKAAFNALDDIHIEKVFVGLPPDVQKQITDSIADKIGNAPAPWDSGYRPGSYSGPGFSAATKGSQTEDDTENPTTQDTKKALRQSQNDKNEALQGSKGTYGRIAGDIQKQVFDAYKEAILEFTNVDQLIEVLEGIPGAAIVFQLINSFACKLPGPLNFDPALDSFMNTVEFDFCNIPGGDWADLTLPQLDPPLGKGVPMKVAANNLMKIIGEVAKEVFIALSMQLLKKVLTALIKATSGIICEALKTLGATLGDLINGNNKLKDALKKKMCPDKVLSDKEFADTLGKLFKGMNPSDPTCLERVTNEEIASFLDDIMLVLTQGQILDLLSGNASEEILEIVTITAASSDSECIRELFSNPSSVETYFDGLGGLLNLDDIFDELGQLPSDLPNTVCTPEMLDDIDDLRCQLLQQKGLSLTECREEIDRLKKQASDNLGDLADILQNGPFAGLPALTSNSDCPADGLFPKNDPTVMSLAGAIISPTFESVSNEFTADLIGDDGVLNNILSDTNGKRLKAHNFYVKYFGSPIASNLGFFEWYSDNALGDPDKTLIAPAPIDQFGEKLRDNEGKGKSLFGGSNGGFPPTVASWLKKQYEDLDIKFETKRLTEEQIELSEIVNQIFTAIGRSSVPSSTDLEMAYIDYKGEYGFKILYDYNIEKDGELLENRYRVKIIEDLSPSDDGNKSRKNIPNDIPPSILKSKNGEFTSGDFIIDSVPSAEIQSILEDLELGSPDKISHETEALKEFMSKNILERTSLNTSQRNLLKSNGHRQHVASIFDVINRGFINRLSDKIATPEKNKSIPKGFSFGYDSNEQPEVILLDAEKHGGNETFPAFYVQPPKREGWLGILDDLVPEWDACEPRSIPMCNFETIKGDVESLYAGLKDDPRLQQTPLCTQEAPYDKILDRMSAASIDGLIRTAMRIYIADILLRAVPVIAQFELNIPDNFDSLLEEYIVDYAVKRIREEDTKVFGGSNHYYYRFLEQVVNNTARKIDAKILKLEDLSLEEQAAFEKIVDVVGDFYLEFGGKPESLSTSAITTQDFLQRAFAHKNSELGQGSAAFNKVETKRAKEEAFKRVIGSTTREAKILMRIYVREEFAAMRTDFNDRLNPTISSLDSLFLGSDKWIQGSVNSGGPLNVFSDPTLEENFETREGDIPVWPFVLEKYIMIEEKDNLSFPNRDENLFHIVNLTDWKDFVDEKAAEGKTGDISKYWKSWKFGIRIVYKPILAADNAYWRQYVKNTKREEIMENKSLLIGGKTAYIPMVEAELPIPDQEFTDFDPGAYDVYCMVKELKAQPEYKTLFRYCFPLQRFLSLLTLYSVKGFYPSIGNEGSPTEGGDRWVNAGGRAPFGFRAWDRKTFERSSKQTRIMFETLYETNNKDTNYKVRGERSNSASFRDTLRPKINFDTGLRWWQRRNQRNRPYDKFGNECEDE